MIFLRFDNFVSADSGFDCPTAISGVSPQSERVCGSYFTNLVGAFDVLTHEV